MRSTVFAVAFSTMSVLACGGDTPTGNGTPTVASVVVTPGNATLVSLSELVPLTASAQDATGNAISGKTFTWSSSAASIATVNSSGEVAAVANGSVTITATTDGVSGKATILVDQVGTELEFTVEPTGAIVGSSIAPAVQVAIQDVLGSTVTDAVDAVTLALVSNNSGTLSGTILVDAVSGVASFDALVIDKGGLDYALVATSGALVSATSAPFSVCLAPPSGLVSWWPGDTDASDIQGTNGGVLTNSASAGAPGKVAGAFSFDGVDGFVSVPDDPSLNVGSADFSLDAWIRTTSTALQTIVDKRLDSRPFPAASEFDIHGYAFSLGVDGLLFQMADGLFPSGFTTFNSGVFLNDGSFHHVAVTVDRDSPTGGKIYVDGAAVFTFDPTVRSSSLNNGANFRIGKIATPQATGVVHHFAGEIDEVELFNRALSATEIQAVFDAGSAGKCKP